MKLTEFFSSRKNKLIYSLICGAAYFALAAGFILKYTSVRTSALLLSFFFAPAIICGAAVVIFKAINGYMENDAVGQLKFLFYAHIAVIILGIVTFIGIFI